VTGIEGNASSIMPLAAIIDDSTLFTSPPNVIAELRDPWANYFNGTSRRLYAGQSFGYTFHGERPHGIEHKGSLSRPQHWAPSSTGLRAEDLLRLSSAETIRSP
jgi:hypothetical protein